jgi:hypothetical protein
MVFWAPDSAGTNGVTLHKKTGSRVNTGYTNYNTNSSVHVKLSWLHESTRRSTHTAEGSAGDVGRQEPRRSDEAHHIKCKFAKVNCSSSSSSGSHGVGSMVLFVPCLNAKTTARRGIGTQRVQFTLAWPESHVTTESSRLFIQMSVLWELGASYGTDCTTFRAI